MVGPDSRASRLAGLVVCSIKRRCGLPDGLTKLDLPDTLSDYRRVLAVLTQLGALTRRRPQTPQPGLRDLPRNRAPLHSEKRRSVGSSFSPDQSGTIQSGCLSDARVSPFTGGMVRPAGVLVDQCDPRRHLAPRLRVRARHGQRAVSSPESRSSESSESRNRCQRSCRPRNVPNEFSAPGHSTSCLVSVPAPVQRSSSIDHHQIACHSTHAPPRRPARAPSSQRPTARLRHGALSNCRARATKGIRRPAGRRGRARRETRSHAAADGGQSAAPLHGPRRYLRRGAYTHPL